MLLHASFLFCISYYFFKNYPNSSVEVDRNSSTRHDGNMKLTKVLSVQNRLGLHARPATAIATLLQTVASTVTFAYGQETVDAKSVLGILMLAAVYGAEIHVVIEGEDAPDVMHRLESAFAQQFGET
jgi:phosphotransferase system HPr (HPr) family protein